MARKKTPPEYGESLCCGNFCQPDCSFPRRWRTAYCREERGVESSRRGLTGPMIVACQWNCSRLFVSTGSASLRYRRLPKWRSRLSRSKPGGGHNIPDRLRWGLQSMTTAGHCNHKVSPNPQNGVLSRERGASRRMRHPASPRLSCEQTGRRGRGDEVRLTGRGL